MECSGFQPFCFHVQTGMSDLLPEFQSNVHPERTHWNAVLKRCVNAGCSETGGFCQTERLFFLSAFCGRYRNGPPHVPKKGSKRPGFHHVSLCIFAVETRQGGGQASPRAALYGSVRGFGLPKHRLAKSDSVLHFYGAALPFTQYGGRNEQ